MDLLAVKTMGDHRPEVLKRATICLFVSRSNCDSWSNQAMAGSLRHFACWNRVALDKLCDRVSGDTDGPAAVHSGKSSLRKPCPDGGDFKV